MVELELCEIAVTEREMIERIGELRVRAWRAETLQSPLITSWLEDFERIARHWAFLRDGQPVASARLSVHGCIEEIPDYEGYVGVFRTMPAAPIASFNRLVVDPCVRGLGLSNKLDLIRLEAAEAMGCKCAVLATPTGNRRVQQLVKVGFEVVGLGNLLLHSPVCSNVLPTLVIYHFPRPES